MAENADHEIIDLDDEHAGPATESDDVDQADALDLEAPPAPDTTKGRVFKIRFKGEEFLIADFMAGRKWRDTQYILASLNGEYGIQAIGEAVTTVIGNEQAAKIEDYEYSEFVRFGEKIAKVVENLIGTAGKSRR